MVKLLLVSVWLLLVVDAPGKHQGPALSMLACSGDSLSFSPPSRTLLSVADLLVPLGSVVAAWWYRGDSSDSIISIFHTIFSKWAEEFKVLHKVLQGTLKKCCRLLLCLNASSHPHCVLTACQQQDKHLNFHVNPLRWYCVSLHFPHKDIIPWRSYPICLRLSR